jgi:hypothetical protein
VSLLASRGGYNPPRATTQVGKLHGWRSSWLGASSKSNKNNPPANQVLLGFENQWINSLIEFCSLFSQGLMGKSQRNAWELKVTNREEWEWALSVLVGLNGQRSKKTVMREEKMYKYLPWSQWSDKSRQCRGLSAAVLHYGIAALQVPRTKPDSKG